VAALRRELGLTEVTALAASMMLGVGIFFGPALTAREFPSTEAVLGLWALGGVIGFAGAWVYGRLAALHPLSGGSFVYLREAYGPFPAYLFVWTAIAVISPTSLAVLASLFAANLAHVAPLTQLGLALLAVWSLAAFAFINVLGVRQGGRVQTAFTVLKVALLGGLAALLLLAAPSSAPAAAPVAGLGRLSVAFVGVLFAYGGWEYAVLASEEVRDAPRTIPRGLLLGAGVVTVVYLLATGAYLQALGPQGMATAQALAPEAAQRASAAGGAFVAIAVAISAAGTLNAIMLLGPRAAFALGREGLAPGPLGWVSPRWGTPLVAIVLQAALASVYLLTGAFATVAAYTVIGTGLFIIPSALALPKLRARATGQRGFRPEDAAAVGLAGVYAWFIAFTLLEDTWTGLVALAIVGAGAAPYALSRRARVGKPTPGAA